MTNSTRQGFGERGKNALEAAVCVSIVRRCGGNGIVSLRVSSARVVQGRVVPTKEEWER